MDRIVDKTVLGTIYLRFAAAYLSAEDRQSLVLGLFADEPPCVPVGDADLGGAFLRWLLLWDALTIAGVDPSEKAHRHISKLVQQFDLGKSWRQRVGERVRQVDWGKGIESTGDKKIESSEGKAGGLFKVVGGWISELQRTPDKASEVSLIDRSDVRKVIEESPLFIEETRRLSENSKEATQRLADLNARLTNDLKEDANSLRQKKSSGDPSAAAAEEASAMIEKLMALRPHGDT